MKQALLSDDPVRLGQAIARIHAREHAARVRRANPGLLQRLFNPRAQREHVCRIGTLTVYSNLRS